MAFQIANLGLIYEANSYFSVIRKFILAATNDFSISNNLFSSLFMLSTLKINWIDIMFESDCFFFAFYSLLKTVVWNENSHTL